MNSPTTLRRSGGNVFTPVSVHGGDIVSLPVWSHVLSRGRGMLSFPVWSHVLSHGATSREGKGVYTSRGPSGTFGLLLLTFWHICQMVSSRRPLKPETEGHLCQKTSSRWTPPRQILPQAVCIQLECILVLTRMHSSRMCTGHS